MQSWLSRGPTARIFEWLSPANALLPGGKLSLRREFLPAFLQMCLDGSCTL